MSKHHQVILHYICIPTVHAYVLYICYFSDKTRSPNQVDDGMDIFNSVGLFICGYDTCSSQQYFSAFFECFFLWGIIINFFTVAEPNIHINAIKCLKQNN